LVLASQDVLRDVRVTVDARGERDVERVRGHVEKAPEVVLAAYMMVGSYQ
jgi:hypothetical protein